jgi:DSF synthase
MNVTSQLMNFASANTHSRVTAEVRRQKRDSLWLTLHRDANRGVHNFSPALLGELRSVIDGLRRTDGQWPVGATTTDIGYLVLKSSDPEYFSVGGDLKHFRTCIAEQNDAALLAYSHQCLDLLDEWGTLLKDRMTSIALVQGRALGGGFEMALSADYIIAEEHSSFGFPEIMFGLFPCTGAMGLLTRRVGAIRAERMMTENKIYTAQQLLDIGVIDEVCATGTGERATEAYIARHTSRQKAFLKVQQSRIRTAPFDYAEGRQIVKDWVELAMGLTAEELRTLDMLILMQEGGRKPKTADRMAA